MPFLVGEKKTSKLQTESMAGSEDLADLHSLLGPSCSKSLENCNKLVYLWLHFQFTVFL